MDQTLRQETYTPVDLREYLGVVRARKWTLIITTLVVLGLALTYSYRQEPAYRASARLLLKPIPSAGFFPSTSLETESQLLRSDLVAERAAKVMKLDTAEGLLGGLEVSPVPESQVLEIFYTAPDPDRAAEAANAFGEGFILYQEQQANRTLEEQRGEVEEQVADIEDDLAKVLQKIEATPQGDAGRLSRLRVEETALSTRLGVLQQQLDELNQPGNLTSQEGGELIEEASPPSAPYSPNHVANGLMGALLGLALGLALVFVRQRLDDRFRGRSDVERTVEAPVLSTVPKLKGRKGMSDRLVALRQPQSGPAEAYRTLRTGLMFTAKQEDLKVFAVTSPREGEGKTLTTSNLAVGLGQTGQQVAVVSADMRRPTLERYFEIDGAERGLSSWLVSDAAGDLPVLSSPADNVDVLPCGPLPDNPAELLTSPRVFELIKQLRKKYDYVLFDTPPVLPVADVATLASMMDGTILVLDAAKTHRSHAAHAAEELNRVGARIVGAVLNNYDPADSPYYYYTPYAYSSTNGARRQNGKGRVRNVTRIFGRR